MLLWLWGVILILAGLFIRTVAVHWMRAYRVERNWRECIWLFFWTFKTIQTVRCWWADQRLSNEDLENRVAGRKFRTSRLHDLNAPASILEISDKMLWKAIRQLRRRGYTDEQIQAIEPKDTMGNVLLDKTIDDVLGVDEDGL